MNEPVTEAELARVAELDAKATPEWWPRHPMGGLEIYADSETNTPLANFKRADDCELAIELRTLTPRLARELAAERAAIKAARAAIENAPHMPFCRVISPPDNLCNCWKSAALLWAEADVPTPEDRK